MYDYMYSDYPDYSSSLTAADTGLFAGIMAFFAAYALVILAIAAVQIIAMWKVFTKAGEEGWKSIIPIYNIIILFKISNMNPLLILVMLIPFVGSLVYFVFSIMQNINLAKAFGKGGGFAAGLILLGPIFYMMLAFGSAEYVGPKYEKAA